MYAAFSCWRGEEAAEFAVRKVRVPSVDADRHHLISFQIFRSWLSWVYEGTASVAVLLKALQCAFTALGHVNGASAHGSWSKP